MLQLKMTFVLGLRYLVLTRYSWLSALVLVSLVPVSLVMAPELLANLFVLDSHDQIYHVSWLSMWCAVTVMETLSVTTLNAHARFDDYQLSIEKFREAWNVEEDETDEWYRTSGGWVTFVLGSVAAFSLWHLIVSACITKTIDDFTHIGGSRQELSWSYWQRAWAGLATTLIIIGVLNGILILFRERRKRLEANSNPADDQPGWQRSLYRGLHFVLGPGYFREQQVAGDRPPILRLAPGHLRMMAYTLAFMVWHLVNFLSVIATQEMPSETSPYAALFYGLLTLLVFSYVLPGAAFYWDRYRIPLPQLIIVTVLIIYSVSKTDHYYELNPTPEPPVVAKTVRYEPPTLETLYESWEWPYDSNGYKTLIVVDASGGGIQASAWTAQVLTGLHQRYGNNFSRSIGLISGVSGGSVGTMFYLANRADLLEGYEPADDSDTPEDLEKANVLKPESIAKINEVSRASALEAAAWGIAYPDLMRLMFAPVSNPTLDRGWATEQIWRQRLKTAGKHVIDHSELRLSDLGQACIDNHLPVPVFNATLLETGQRLQISPVLGPATGEEAAAGAVQFMKVFKDSHPRISTAARLSATFPYVTPASRSNPEEEDGLEENPLAEYHVVDGAYVDNEGAVTSVDWLHRLLNYYSQDENILKRPFDRILLIRIQAFPKKTNADPNPDVKPTSGWRSALAGPLEAMMRVRSTSQIERADLEISLLKEANGQAMLLARDKYRALLEKAEERLEQAKQTGDEELIADMEATVLDLSDRMNQAELLELVPVLFDFPPTNVKIPLSWKLTKKQKSNIDAAWADMVDNEPHPSVALLDEDYFFELDDE